MTRPGRATGNPLPSQRQEKDGLTSCLAALVRPLTWPCADRSRTPNCRTRSAQPVRCALGHCASRKSRSILRDEQFSFATTNAAFSECAKILSFHFCPIALCHIAVSTQLSRSTRIPAESAPFPFLHVLFLLSSCHSQFFCNGCVINTSRC